MNADGLLGLPTLCQADILEFDQSFESNEESILSTIEYLLSSMLWSLISGTDISELTLAL